MPDAHEDLSPLMHEAFDWIIRLSSGSATRADARAFEAWQKQGPEHARAVREAATLRRTLRAMPLATTASASPQLHDDVGANNVVPFSQRRPAAMSRRAMLAGSGGAIAASAAFLTINPPFGLWLSLAELNAGERTAIGERRTLHPSSGVTLEMNARTAVNFDADAGKARLIAGEVFAAVAQAGRPLVLEAGGESWKVQAAEANIRTSERATCITCISGVLIQANGSITLRGGQQYTAISGDAPRIASVDVERSGSWRRGVLLFRQTPLVEVVEDINRYRTGMIILANAGIGDRPVSGMFHTDKIGNAPGQLQQLLGLKLTQLPGDVVVLS